MNDVANACPRAKAGLSAMPSSAGPGSAVNRHVVALALMIAQLASGSSFAATLDAGNKGRTVEYRLGERLPPAPVTTATAYKEVNWDVLVPVGWDPLKVLKGLDLAKLGDADPRAIAAFEKLRAEWNNAPANKSLNGVRIRIAGFVVPLENNRDQMSEFLVVPYFGACIHSPPPPANQVIHVFPAAPVRGLRPMEAVWVSGVVETVHAETGMGSAGYRIRAEAVGPYRKPRE